MEEDTSLTRLIMMDEGLDEKDYKIDRIRHFISKEGEEECKMLLGLLASQKLERIKQGK